MSRWSRGVLNKVIAAQNQLVLPIVRIARKYMPHAKVHVEASEDRRVVVVTVDMPKGRPWVLGLYVTGQESRPLSPRDVQRMLMRLNREVARLAPPYRDITKFILAASRRVRTTIGARRVLAQHLVKVVDVVEAARILASYFGTRAAKLREILRRGAADERLKLLTGLLEELEVALDPSFKFTGLAPPP